MVLEQDKAWHVGSENPYTIGYEHEGYVTQPQWYTEAMYIASADLSRDIVNPGYGIPAVRTYYGDFKQLPRKPWVDVPKLKVTNIIPINRIPTPESTGTGKNITVSLTTTPLITTLTSQVRVHSTILEVQQAIIPTMNA